MRVSIGWCGWWRSASAVLTLVALTACGALGDRLAPGRSVAQTAAQVALTTVLPRTLVSDGVTLEVAATYARQNGSDVRLGSRTMSLSNAAEQAVPVPVDLATCLADAARAATTPRNGCIVTLMLALIVNGAVVDRQVVGPLTLTPGVTSSVAQPVSLFEIAALDLSFDNGAPLPTGGRLTLVAGNSTSLRAVVLDRAGVVVPGRQVQWRSESPTVVSTDARGTLRASAPGIARVTATVEHVGQSLDVRVVRPQVDLQLRGARGSGSGRVRSLPTGIDCLLGGEIPAGACTFKFAADTTVTLTAEPQVGSRFVGWGDACASSDASPVCQLSTSTGLVASARFVALRRVRVLGGEGDGRGHVRSEPGINCMVGGGRVTGTCEVLVPEGTTLTLRADLVEGEHKESFAGWTGACATAEPECHLAVGNRDAEVQANFHDARVLQVQTFGGGNGVVTGPDGVECTSAGGVASGMCGLTGVHGRVITLRAESKGSSRFLRWSGPCADRTTPECTFTLDRAQVVGATFVALRRLSVETGDGDGVGRVRGPGGLDCIVSPRSVSGDCEVMVADDQAVVTASVEGSESNRQTFVGWVGTCGVAPTCRVTLAAEGARVVPRFFGEQRLAIGVAGAGDGTVVASGTSRITCALVAGRVSGPCSASEPYGTQVTLQAVPDDRSAFLAWSGPCEVVATRTCVTTLTEARRVVAEFTTRMVPLTMTIAGNGSGALLVDRTPACTSSRGVPSTCTLDFRFGRRVEISASPEAGSLFSGLAGYCLGATRCYVDMTVPRRVDARFDLGTLVDITPTGRGSGTVTAPGINCVLAAGATSGTCRTLVALRSSVTIVATPDATSRVAAWTGRCTSTTGTTCTVIASEVLRISVRFAPLP